MIFPFTRVTHISAEKGLGVVATEKIPKGTITWVFDELDREFSPEAFARMSPLTQESILNYSYTNRTGNLVFCWDNERYINHSFKANCMLTPYNFEIALQDIEKDEELTDDYGFLNIIAPFSADSEGTDRTTVYPDDLLRYSDIWDAQLRQAFAHLLEVRQPLKPYFSPADWQQVVSIASGQKPMESIRTCYFDRNNVNRISRQ